MCLKHQHLSNKSDHYSVFRVMYGVDLFGICSIGQEDNLSLNGGSHGAARIEANDQFYLALSLKCEPRSQKSFNL